MKTATDIRNREPMTGDRGTVTVGGKFASAVVRYIYRETYSIPMVILEVLDGPHKEAHVLKPAVEVHWLEGHKNPLRRITKAANKNPR